MHAGGFGGLTPLFVHPEASRELVPRSAGRDKRRETPDDLIVAPAGIQPARR